MYFLEISLDVHATGSIVDNIPRCSLESPLHHTARLYQSLLSIVICPAPLPFLSIVGDRAEFLFALR